MRHQEAMTKGEKGKGRGKAPIIRPSGYVKKNGPDPKSVAEADWSRVLDAASLGIPFERLCHLAGMTDKTFTK